MSKKIVVITGSPRKKGNSFAMTEVFIKAAEKKGHTVKRFDAAMMSVSGCHACETCFKEADAVVFSMPVYWYTIPSQIKAVIDKLFSFYHAEIDISGKECAIITCCEEDDKSVMDGIRIPIERSAALLKWKMIGAVMIPAVVNTGDIDKTDGCVQAATLADKF